VEAAIFYAAWESHNDPDNPYCMLLYAAFVIGFDIKTCRQVIHVNFANIWFVLNAVRAIEGWVVQLNEDATFGFCSADFDMIALGLCSFGKSNNIGGQIHVNQEAGLYWFILVYIS
jgi:hypothetical protein